MRSAWLFSRPALRWCVAIGILLAAVFLVTTLRTAAIEPGTERFERTWNRTDRPVLEGLTARTWMWGPEANSVVVQEAYEDAPGGVRAVQYFDKARMEDNSYRADGAPWDVTNGLLVVELITGEMQIGDAQFESRDPAAVNVAGDSDDPTGPTYATFGALLDASPRAPGETVIQRVDRDGNVVDDAALTGQGVTIAALDEVTNHAIAAPFWDFMNSSGTVYEDGQFVSDLLFESPYFATGRPITEAYWANVKIAGTYRDVLMQCFERRCLTYTPGNPAGFVVEAGNVGQHYYQWRYDGDTPEPAPTASPSATPSATAGATGTAEPTTTVEPTATITPSPEPTATATPEPATEYAFLTKFGQQSNGIKLNEPTMAATAPNGDIYVTNTAEHRILRFAANGQLITAWGSEGTNTGQFKFPVGIGVDGSGNVYVADKDNHRIQKFDANGAFITTWGSEGVNQGQFKFPYGLDVGPDGTIYVTELGNNRVQRFGSSGNPVRIWGGLGSLAGQFVTPHGIAVNGALVYVADAGNQRVQIFDVDGGFQGSFGQAGTGAGQFSLPLGVTVAGDGTAYVSDIGDDRIQVFTIEPVIAPAGNRTLAAITYQYAGTVGEPGQFNNPVGLGFDGNGRLMVADASNNALKFFVSNSITPQQPGPFTLADTWVDDTRGRFTSPYGIAQGHDGRVYVADLYESTQDLTAAQIQVFSPDGAYLDQWRGLVPAGLAFDSEGNLFTFNLANGRMEKFSPDGELLAGWGPANPQVRVLVTPLSLAIDADDNVYVAHGLLNNIQKFSPEGVFLDAWGAPGSQPGQLSLPTALAIHGDRIYVTEAGNNRVQVFDLDGTYQLHWGSEGTADGQFDGPTGVAVDVYGFVYVTDNGNHRVQKFTPDGVFLAKWGSEGTADGQFLTPYDLFVDPAGDVYVLDLGNHRVQVFRPVS